MLYVRTTTISYLKYQESCINNEIMSNDIRFCIVICIFSHQSSKQYKNGKALLICIQSHCKNKDEKTLRSKNEIKIHVCKSRQWLSFLFAGICATESHGCVKWFLLWMWIDFDIVCLSVDLYLFSDSIQCKTKTLNILLCANAFKSLLWLIICFFNTHWHTNVESTTTTNK